MLLSVVVPVYNEEAVLPAFLARLRPVVDAIGGAYEVIMVDDGSVDGTAAALQRSRRDWPELRIVRLRRNCGHQAALTAGLHRSRGRYVVSIDADLQDPPEVIAEMVTLARGSGLDVVYAIRTDRSVDTWFKRWTAAGYYRLVRRLVGRTVPAQAGDFRLLSQEAVEALRQLPEATPVYRLVVPWLGFPHGEVTYQRAPRAAGRTNYPVSRMVQLALDSVTSFSAAPLRLATLLGLGGVLTCVGLALAAFVAYARGSVVSGWSSIMVAVLFLGALQLLCLGLLGEYIARIFLWTRGRPAYLVAYDSAAGAAREPADPADLARPADPDDLARPAGVVPGPRRPGTGVPSGR